MTAPARALDVRAPASLTPAQLRSAPALEPPYDDDTSPSRRAVTPTLRLVPRQTHLAELPFGGDHRRRPRAARTPGPDDDPFGPWTTPRAALPDPAEYAPRFVQVVLEVLGHRRPLLQLMPLTSEDVYEQLTWWLHPTVGNPQLRGARPAALRSVRVSEPADGVAEVTAVVSHAGRTRAIVLRLEGLDGRWQCTLIRML